MIALLRRSFFCSRYAVCRPTAPPPTMRIRLGSAAPAAISLGGGQAGRSRAARARRECGPKARNRTRATTRNPSAHSTIAVTTGAEPAFSPSASSTAPPDPDRTHAWSLTKTRRERSHSPDLPVGSPGTAVVAAAPSCPGGPAPGMDGRRGGGDPGGQLREPLSRAALRDQVAQRRRLLLVDDAGRSGTRRARRVAHPPARRVGRVAPQEDRCTDPSRSRGGGAGR